MATNENIAQSVKDQVKGMLVKVQSDIAQNEAIGMKDESTQKARIADLQALVAGATRTQAEAELSDVKVQLGAVEGTLTTQQKSCNESKETNEQRALRAEKEKIALEEALSILKAED